MRWVCVIGGATVVAILTLAGWTAMRSHSDRKGRVVTVVESPPPGFEQPRYVGWVFGKMVGINSSDCAWPAPGPSSQPTSDAP